MVEYVDYRSCFFDDGSMATEAQIEAQRLVTISLTKMAQSRTQRTGISLHKSLLVATVLQKARYLCMEEVCRMLHSSPAYQQHHLQHHHHHLSHNNNNTAVNDMMMTAGAAAGGGGGVDSGAGSEQQYDFEDDDDHLIALTPEEAGIATDQPEPHTNVVGFSELVAGIEEESFGTTTASSSAATTTIISNGSAGARRDNELNSEYDKENLAPSEAPTYFDLDKAPRDQCFRERSTTITSSSASSYCKNLKRRRAVCDSETEEAVQSILPKKTRTLSFDSDCDDSVFGDDDPFLVATAGGDANTAVLVSSTCGVVGGDDDDDDDDDDDIGSKSMDIDRITSLVSIFSFGGMTPSSSTSNLSSDSSSAAAPTAVNSTATGNSYNNLTRSSSTPDLCSAQAKETDSLQQRPFLAMTV